MKFKLTNYSAHLRHLAFRAAATVLVVVISLMLVPQAFAQDLYTVAVPMDPRDPAARETAYSEALTRVLIRVTGSDDEVHLEELAQIFPNPGRYVLRFRPAPDDTLEVTFDGDAIQTVLRQTRHAIWDENRPLTLVWLAVDWGQGEREIVAADDAMPVMGATRSIDRNRLLRERVEETAEWRGIPVVFPLLDTEDLENISFGDIWGGFDDRVIEASRRYGANSILVGRIRPESGQRNRWTYYFGEDRLSWSGEPEEVIHLVADQLAALFAISGDAVLETYALTIDGVDSVVAYGSVQQMMDNLNVVEAYSLRKVSGKRMEFDVRVYGGIDRLSKALELSGILQPVFMIDDSIDGRPAVPNPNLLAFEYLP